MTKTMKNIQKINPLHVSHPLVGGLHSSSPLFFFSPSVALPIWWVLWFLARGKRKSGRRRRRATNGERCDHPPQKERGMEGESYPGVLLICLPESQRLEKASDLFYHQRKVKTVQKGKEKTVFNQTTNCAKASTPFPLTTPGHLHDPPACLGSVILILHGVRRRTALYSSFRFFVCISSGRASAGDAARISTSPALCVGFGPSGLCRSSAFFSLSFLSRLVLPTHPSTPLPPPLHPNLLDAHLLRRLSQSVVHGLPILLFNFIIQRLAQRAPV